METADEAVETDDAGAEPPPIDDERYEALKEEVRQLRGVVTGRKPAFTLRGYADVGFFVRAGRRQRVRPGRRPAVDARFFPQYAGRYGWVFLGDILAPPINSRGEAGRPRQPARASTAPT